MEKTNKQNINIDHHHTEKREKETWTRKSKKYVLTEIWENEARTEE